MADVFGIEPDHAGLQRIGHPQRAAHVAGPDIAGQAVLHAVGDLDRVLLVLERDHGQERPNTSSCATRIFECAPVTSVGCT